VQRAPTTDPARYNAARFRVPATFFSGSATLSEFCCLRGIHTAVPPLRLPQSAAPELFAPACADERQQRVLRRLTRLSDVEGRHLAVLEGVRPVAARPIYRNARLQPGGPGMGARDGLFLELAAPLVAECVRPFGDALGLVENLVTVCCTHASAPSLEQPVFALGALQPTVQHWRLGFMGCSAALAGLRLAHAVGGWTLIVSCELSSLHFQYSGELDQLTANMLFADGAAAALVSPGRGGVRIVGAACVTLPSVAGQMRWQADDHGLRLRLAPELPSTIGTHLPAIVGAFLDRQGLSRRAIAHWLVHPGGPQVLAQVAAALELPADALALSHGVLRRFGNMSSPTILFIMQEWLAPAPDGYALVLAFGPGLMVELLLLDARPPRCHT
jgi:predicted naringenin-chalcone synthase